VILIGVVFADVLMSMPLGFPDLRSASTPKILVTPDADIILVSSEANCGGATGSDV
jgi:hypothetical protein